MRLGRNRAVPVSPSGSGARLLAALFLAATVAPADELFPLFPLPPGHYFAGFGEYGLQASDFELYGLGGTDREERRLHPAVRAIALDPGAARFLLLSMTYGSKGYRYSLPEFRQRDIGIELGVNFPEILTAVGVPERSWWGRSLYMFFNFVRIPFTSIGFHYDLNHQKWHRPDAGNVYDPGP